MKTNVSATARIADRFVLCHGGGKFEKNAVAAGLPVCASSRDRLARSVTSSLGIVVGSVSHSQSGFPQVPMMQESILSYSTSKLDLEEARLLSRCWCWLVGGGWWQGGRFV